VTVPLAFALALGLAGKVAVGLAATTSVSLGSPVGDAVGAGVAVGADALALALAAAPGIAPTSRMPASSETMTIIRARPTSKTLRRIRPFRGGLSDETTGRGISGPVGAKGGRGRAAPAMDLATHVRQLRRELLQHSLHTNWRHSWQKRKLWTND
jgi:hypothetical protein